MHYVCQKTTISRGGSYKNYPKSIKNKKATINSKNHDDDGKWKHQNKSTKNKRKLSLRKSVWIEGHKLSHPCKKWEKFLNNKSITLNVLFVPHNKKEIREAYISKHNSEHPNQVILLMIPGGKK